MAAIALVEFGIASAGELTVGRGTMVAGLVVMVGLLSDTMGLPLWAAGLVERELKSASRIVVVVWGTGV